jgi:hypothetical protein
MAQLFTVIVEETESLDLCGADGAWRRSYATGRGVAMHRSPRRAVELAHSNCARDLYRRGLALGWEGIGGTPILFSRRIEKGGRLIKETW